MKANRSYPARRSVWPARALVAALSLGAVMSPPPAARAQDPAASDSPVGPPVMGTQRLMEQLRDLGLAPEQESMEPEGLYDPEPRPTLLEALRAEQPVAEPEGPGEPLLSLPPWAIPAFREELRAIVRELARYARARDPGFAILARGGAPLAVRDRREAVLEAARAVEAGLGAVDPDSPAAGVGEISSGFVGAVDGLVLDGQFCGQPPLDPETLAVLRDLDMALLSVDHCVDAEGVVEAHRLAAEAGVLLLVDTDDHGRLDRVPGGRPMGENADNITDPRQARSALVLEHGGGFGDVSLLVGALRATNHDIIIVNPFVIGGRALTAQQVAELRYKKLGARRMVLATFNVALAREDTYYWQPKWRLGDPRWLSATVRDRPGAYFTEYWDPDWKTHLGEHFVGLMDLGFDGVVLDGLDVVHRWEAITPVE
ncbi:hypothetical protein [Roseospira visakhapatnamensis]|uniref:Glycoside-hydrolase family GH114 TIM-barrel domain-containing protein n=1 Tax=Roseospira visakhapatnamensis TaxID=390880 RepID=A0A7W6RAE8_9PROT|nr:hypothetical protein [Roseospira visakhapatnamensis]MBB4264496.1 hypothetical protein [Roseospira visakhapatnamensis]